MCLGQQTQPQILDLIGVLIFVHQDIFEALLILRQHIVMLAEDVQHVQQKIAEVAGVQRLQAILVKLVELRAAPVGISFVFHRIEIARIEPAVLPAIDQTGQLAGRPAFFIQILVLDKLFQQAQLIIGIDDGVIALQANDLGMPAQHPCTDRVEGAEPGHAFYRIADMAAHAFAHLARGLVGKGDAEDFAGPGSARRNQMRQPRGKRSGLSRACPGQHQDRAFGRQDSLLLRLVQRCGIGRKRGAWRFFGRGGKVGHCARTGSERGAYSQPLRSCPGTMSAVPA